MSATIGAPRHGTAPAEQRQPWRAVQAEPRVLVALLTVAGLAWWSTSVRMAGMDAGPGADLGALGWFAGVWAVMMAAMMLPSLAPAAAFAVPHRLRQVTLFAGGYLLVWCAVGVVAYVGLEAARDAVGDGLSWSGGGRGLAAAVLACAAAYQLTPFKRASLDHCRGRSHTSSDMANGALGAIAGGARMGGWCLACSWALMAALFALGVMNLTWMAVIAVLVAIEKLGPSARAARIATCAVLAALAFGVLALPTDVPGFVTPGSSAMVGAQMS